MPFNQSVMILFKFAEIFVCARRLSGSNVLRVIFCLKLLKPYLAGLLVIEWVRNYLRVLVAIYFTDFYSIFLNKHKYLNCKFL